MNRKSFLSLLGLLPFAGLLAKGKPVPVGSNPVIGGEVIYPKIPVVETFYPMDTGSWKVRGRFDFDSSNESKRVVFTADIHGSWLLLTSLAKGIDYNKKYHGSISDPYKPRSPDVAEDTSPMTAMRISSIRKPGVDEGVCATFTGKSRDIDEDYNEVLKGLLYFNAERVDYECNHSALIHFLGKRQELHRLRVFDTVGGKRRNYTVVRDEAGMYPDRIVKL